MNSHSTTPSSGRSGTARKTGTRSGGTPCMSPRQAEAYLLARDTVRRIQRMSSLAGAASRRPTASVDGAVTDAPPSH